jgi:hypothetical protein
MKGYPLLPLTLVAFQFLRALRVAYYFNTPFKLLWVICVIIIQSRDMSRELVMVLQYLVSQYLKSWPGTWSLEERHMVR